MRLYKDDLVVVVKGANKRTAPCKVIRVSSAGSVFLDGVGTVVKHIKRGSTSSPQGGRVALPVSIHRSNVALYCASCLCGVRARVVSVSDGKKRACVKCSGLL